MQITYKATLYKQQQDTIEYARIVQDPTGLRKISGVLSQDSNYNTVQSIAQIEEIEEPELEGALKALKAKGFKEQLEGKKDVLFVQLQVRACLDFSNRAANSTFLIILRSGNPHLA